MKRVLAGLTGMLTTLALHASVVFANEPKGGAADYSGVSYLYYTMIGVILVYGVYDTFFKKS